MTPTSPTPLVPGDLVTRVNSLATLVRALPPTLVEQRLLVWQEPGLPVRWHELLDAVTVGRHPRCEVVLETPSVSRRHARIEPREDGWWIIDLESSHGVRRNGRKIEHEVPLCPGDWLEFGATGMGYLEMPEAPPGQ